MRLGTAAASIIALTSAPATLSAQSLPPVAPALPRADPEYQVEPRRLGLIDVSFDLASTAYVDSNVFATPDDEVTDVVFEVAPFVRASTRSGAFTAQLEAGANFRRFADRTTQDTDAASILGSLVYSPRQGETISLTGGWQRTIEDRGDPEARLSLDLGPREIDISTVSADYRNAGGQVLYDIHAEMTRFDARDNIDDDRDFRIVGGSASIGVKAQGRLYLTASAFGTRRDFRLDVAPTGIDNDATIYGARAGVEILPGGPIEGRFSAGVFRNEPDDPLLEDRTGLSLDGFLTVRPTRRMALIFQASNGDVATFRGGAAGRTDTIARVTWQHEIRHNLYSSASIGYRRSDFEGASVREETIIAGAELEYVVARKLSLFTDLSFGSRTSDLAREEFDRFRGGLGVRFRF